MWFTLLLNRIFGKAALALLTRLHVHPKDAHLPIPDHVAMEILVFLIAIAFFLWLRARISVERPGATQQSMEMLLTNSMGVGVRDLLEETIPHHPERYLAMIGSIGMFVLFCNLISLIPTLRSPTAQASVPLGCAAVVFLYYNWAGLRQHGPRYGKQFLGPILFVSPVMFIVEIFSHLARMLSLTVRLWVNMLVSEMLYVMFLGLTLSLFFFTGKLNAAGYATGVMPFFVPLAFIALHIFVAVLQAFVFTILPIIYVSGAVAEEH